MDWVQYKQNFREIVTVSRGAKVKAAVMDMRIDTRQVTPDNLRAEMLRALTAADSERFLETPIHDRIPLEAFKSFRHSIAWEFNRLYWTHLGDWEKATGKGYQQALPGGKSDGNDEQAVVTA